MGRYRAWNCLSFGPYLAHKQRDNIEPFRATDSCEAGGFEAQVGMTEEVDAHQTVAEQVVGRRLHGHAVSTSSVHVNGHDEGVALESVGRATASPLSHLLTYRALPLSVVTRRRNHVVVTIFN